MSNRAGDSSSQSTMSSLLRRAKNREPNAWETLVQIYGPLVYYWCRKSRLQQADAADAVQEIFHRVAIGLETFERRSVGSFRGWLRVITRNKVTDIVRRSEKQPQASGGSSAQAAMHAFADPLDVLSDDFVIDLGRYDNLNNAIETLRSEIKETTWRVLWLTTVEDRDPDFVARTLGMNVGAVYQAKSRALMRLREILTDLEGRSRNESDSM